MFKDNIWNEYVLILLAIFSLLFGCIRDGGIDELIAHIPIYKWNRYNRWYKYILIRYHRCSVGVNRKWLVYITVGLFLGAWGLYQINLWNLCNHCAALMLVTATFAIVFPLKETIVEHKWELSTKELIMLTLLSIIILYPKILFGKISDFNVTDGVRVLGIWITYWLIFRYIPFKVCNIMIWAINLSKKMALKEAYRKEALRSFLKCCFAAALGLGLNQINKMINLGNVVLDCGSKWFVFLLGG